MSKTNRCVVRNAANKRGNLGDRYRHNERHNSCYGNGDVVPERSHLNVQFKACEGTYTEAFDKLVADGVISLRGLGKDPKIVDELVFDVNSEYFENHGGYEYATAFFAEAYRLAVKEAGGEQYVLSAVMHADERNAALSEKLGRDAYHYHLHVVYVPVVEKRVYFRKNNKDPELAGKLKEVVMQVSHSKKWPREKRLDERGEVVRNEDGKAVLVNSYSLLQDRFHEHMTAAGFTDFERGERGSTAQHLDTLQYKIRQDTARAAEKEAEAAALDKQLTAKQRRSAGLDKDIAVKMQAAAVFMEIDKMGKKKMSGKVEVSGEDWRELASLAKKGVAAQVDIPALKRQLAVAQRDNEIYRRRSAESEKYRKAKLIDPKRADAIVAEIIRQGRADHTNTRQNERKHNGPEL